MQFVVRGQRSIDVPLGDCLTDTEVGLTHCVQLGFGEVTDGSADGELVHRGHHITRLTDCALRKRADRGRTPRMRGNQAGLSQAEQRLTDGRAADPEPCGEIDVTQLLSRCEGAVDDSVTQPVIDVVPEQTTIEGWRILWNRHAIYCTCSPGDSKQARHLSVRAMCSRVSTASRARAGSSTPGPPPRRRGRRRRPRKLGGFSGRIFVSTDRSGLSTQRRSSVDRSRISWKTRGPPSSTRYSPQP